MQRQNLDRLGRWKCLVCGSTKKDVRDILSIDQKNVLKISVCCGCGNVQLYANSADSVAGLLLNDFAMAYRGITENENTEDPDKGHIPGCDSHKEMLETIVNPIFTNIRG